MPRTITITVPLKGISQGKSHVRMTTNGFAGQACRDASKAFEAAIGVSVKEELTNEFYDTPKVEIEAEQERTS